MSAHVQLVELGRTSVPLPNLGGQRAEEPAATRSAPRGDISIGAVEARLAALPLEEMDVVYDGNEGVLFAYFNFAGRPSFTPAILRDIGRLQDAVRTLFAAGGGSAPIRYLIWDSHMPGVWNLGGDLDLFATMIRRQDRDGLMRYARAVIEEGYANATNLNLPLITVSLVRGDALGGGFEAALSSNVIVAERSARFGLPEILFNLFPGMGAYTFLARRVAPGLAERVILSGEMYSAEQLYAMGAIDVLAPDGQGLNALYDFIGRGGKRHSALRALYRARRSVSAVTFEEMMHIADLWVEAAVKLDESGLRRMSRLVAAQDRRILGRAV